MTKRYREAVDVEGGEGGLPPLTFTWRGSTYRVVGVLGHWREDGGWWSGGGIEIPQRDLWRVEAGRALVPAGGAREDEAPAVWTDRARVAREPRGVYELVREASGWRLDRVWD